MVKCQVPFFSGNYVFSIMAEFLRCIQSCELDRFKIYGKNITWRFFTFFIGYLFAQFKCSSEIVEKHFTYLRYGTENFFLQINPVVRQVSELSEH